MQSQPIIIARNDGMTLLIRAVYFVLIGWWLSAIWAVVGWILSVSIIGLPLGVFMLNRLPQAVTLKPARTNLTISPSGQVVHSAVPQRPFLLRALYFVLIGWWLSALWIVVAWMLHVTIIGMVVGFWMFDQVPGILTLRRD